MPKAKFTILRRLTRGTVERRAGRWRNRYRAEVLDPVTGEVRVRELNRSIAKVSEVSSRAYAARLLDAALAADAFQPAARGERVFALAYSEQFIREVVRGYRPNSARNYRRAIRRDLQPAMEGLYLDQLNASWLRGILADKAEVGAAQSTIAFLRRVALQVLRQAARDGEHVQRIIPGDVRLPKTTRPPRERPFVTEEQLAVLLSGTEHPLRAMIAMGGLAGMRISEILGTCWNDLNLHPDEEAITIRHQAQGGGLVACKTSTSSEPLPMLSPLPEILREYRKVWKPNASGYLFATREGRTLSAGDVRARLWHPTIRRLELPYLTPHALRHGLPRRLLKHLSPQDAMVLMRHKDLKMTTRYHHFGTDDLRRSLAAAGLQTEQPEQLP